MVPDALSRIAATTVFTPDATVDAWHQRLLERLRKNQDDYPDFKIVDEELYKNCVCKDELGLCTHIWKKVVPESKRAETIKQFHDKASAAHLGFYKTWQKLQTHFYWPKMREDVSRYVKSCAVCKAAKAPNTCIMPNKGAVKPARLPWELISVDFIGPSRVRAEGTRSCL